VIDNPSANGSADRWVAPGRTAHAEPSEACPAAPSDLIFLPSPDFWREEAPRSRGTRYLTFDLTGGVYALPLAFVREVDRVPTVTPLPNVASWVLGAANLRGEILSVVDLAAFLGLSAPHQPRDARLLVCRAGSMEAGLVVEQIRDIRELPEAAIRQPTGAIPGRSARYLVGVHAGEGRLTRVLDIARLLHAPEFRRFE
jgi:purine-binding chemotaxis protein CheW